MPVLHTNTNSVFNVYEVYHNHISVSSVIFVLLPVELYLLCMHTFFSGSYFIAQYSVLYHNVA